MQCLTPERGWRFWLILLPKHWGWIWEKIAMDTITKSLRSILYFKKKVPRFFSGHIEFGTSLVINRPSVAGAVLQTAL